MTNFVIEVDAPVELTKEQHRGVEQAVLDCLVHHTLLHPPKISRKVEGLASAAKQ